MVNAFIISQLDYCNALYTGIDLTQINRLQLVENKAARLLQVWKKTVMFVGLPFLSRFAAIQWRRGGHTQGVVASRRSVWPPAHLYLVGHQRPLWSAHLLVCTPVKGYFLYLWFVISSVAATRLRNTLPLNIQTALSVEDFKSHLKLCTFHPCTYLYRHLKN